MRYRLTLDNLHQDEVRDILADLYPDEHATDDYGRPLDDEERAAQWELPPRLTGAHLWDHRLHYRIEVTDAP